MTPLRSSRYVQLLCRCVGTSTEVTDGPRDSTRADPPAITCEARRGANARTVEAGGALRKRCENVRLHRTSAASGNYAQEWYIFARRPYACYAPSRAKPSDDPDVCQLIDAMGAPVVVEGWVAAVAA